MYLLLQTRKFLNAPSLSKPIPTSILTMVEIQPTDFAASWTHKFIAPSQS